MVKKAVLLVGGHSKGTRFRPLSLDVPKPLFPLGGIPLLTHRKRAAMLVTELGSEARFRPASPGQDWRRDGGVRARILPAAIV
jgi:hypothetical protein